MRYLGALSGAFLFLALSGCHSNGGGPIPGSLTGTGFVGLWIQKEDADALRATGKISSTLCDDIHKEKEKTVVLNVWAIENDGSIYAYAPKFGEVDYFKMGTLAPSGAFTVTGRLTDDYKDTTIRVS